MSLLITSVLVSGAASWSKIGDLVKVMEALIVKELVCLGSFPSKWYPSLGSDSRNGAS